MRYPTVYIASFFELPSSIADNDAFLFQLPLGATPLSSFFASLALRLTKTGIDGVTAFSFFVDDDLGSAFIGREDVSDTGEGDREAVEWGEGCRVEVWNELEALAHSEGAVAASYELVRGLNFGGLSGAV
jgi:hypothetical protein